ncbi:hypothetical protein BGY98DRAFT_201130 [Russula aff. rugulosa BPL654]|nr:hypothetical protein BGY98DRAFT_201130 [Russula aff. rugulosa BPL654]
MIRCSWRGLGLCRVRRHRAGRHLVPFVGDGRIRPVHDSTMEASTSTHPLSAADGATPESDSITEASTFTHPLSAADGPASAPESDPIAEASTSSYLLSAADGPAPEFDRITEASTSSHHSSATERQCLCTVRQRRYQQPSLIPRKCITCCP